MQQWIEAHGMAEEIVLAGSRTQEELIPIYQKADLFLLTPIITEDGDRDGIPNVFVEAMAVGLPVISTSVAGIPEVIIHDHNGLLYPPMISMAWPAGVMDLLQDESKRRQLGEAAFVTAVEKLDVNQAASKLRDLFVQASRTQLANASELLGQPTCLQRKSVKDRGCKKAFMPLVSGSKFWFLQHFLPALFSTESIRA